MVDLVPLLQVKDWVLVANIEGSAGVEPRLEENILLVLVELGLRLEVVLLLLLLGGSHGGDGGRGQSITRTCSHTSSSSFHTSCSITSHFSSSISFFPTSCFSMLRLCRGERLTGLDSAVQF